METVATWKTKGQESLTNLAKLGKERPIDWQTVGLVAGATVVGGVVGPAAANGALAIIATLAAPPIALTLGALGGGVIGWKVLQHRAQQNETRQPEPVILVVPE